MRSGLLCLQSFTSSVADNHKDTKKDMEEGKEKGIIHMPARTHWPVVLAFGLTLIAAGLVTSAAVSLVGLLIVVRAAIGWWHEVLPVEKHEEVPVSAAYLTIRASERSVVQLKPGQGGHRVRIPAEIHPYSSGIKGG